MIIPFSEAASIREKLGVGNGKLVFTNGCFDILHAGHVRYLEGARTLGEALVVGLNGDESVRALKGPNRPINPESDRAEVLAALRAVDAVIVFPETKATGLIENVRPDIYVKGGDYDIESLDVEERLALEKAKCSIQFLPLVPGRSTTTTLKKNEGHYLILICSS